MRKLRIDMEDLQMAFEDASPEVQYFLNVETGEVVMVSDEVQRALERIYEELPKDAEDFAALFQATLEQSDLHDWMKEEVRRAGDVEAGFPKRYVRIPQHESRDGYGDMEAFIETVGNPHFRELLEVSIQGRGAFRRFKDTVARDPDELKRWYAFRDERLRERIREWLADEEIELETG